MHQGVVRRHRAPTSRWAGRARPPRLHQAVHVVTDDSRERRVLARDLSTTGIRLIATRSLLGQQMRLVLGDGPDACSSWCRSCGPAPSATTCTRTAACSSKRTSDSWFRETRNRTSRFPSTCTALKRTTGSCGFLAPRSALLPGSSARRSSRSRRPSSIRDDQEPADAVLLQLRHQLFIGRRSRSAARRPAIARSAGAAPDRRGTAEPVARRRRRQAPAPARRGFRCWGRCAGSRPRSSRRKAPVSRPDARRQAAAAAGPLPATGCTRGRPRRRRGGRLGSATPESR